MLSDNELLLKQGIELLETTGDNLLTMNRKQGLQGSCPVCRLADWVAILR